VPKDLALYLADRALKTRHRFSQVDLSLEQHRTQLEESVPSVDRQRLLREEAACSVDRQRLLQEEVCLDKARLSLKVS
jgi:hypothetical protein